MHLCILDTYMPPVKNKGKHGLGGHRNEPFVFEVWSDCAIPPELIELWRQMKGVMRVTTPQSGAIKQVFFSICVFTDTQKIFGVETLEEVPAVVLKQLPTS